MSRRLKPIKLHDVIGTSTVWTDQLWTDAVTYLAENTATPDAIAITRMLLGDEKQHYLHKIDYYLKAFSAFPPTVLLGAFDLMRYRKAQRADW